VRHLIALLFPFALLAACNAISGVSSLVEVPCVGACADGALDGSGPETTGDSSTGEGSAGEGAAGEGSAGDAPLGDSLGGDGGAPLFSGIDDLSAWTAFDLASLAPQAQHFNGVTFDGRYVYYAPFGPEPMMFSLVARLDTQGVFTTATSWTLFDLTKVSPNAAAYRGLAFDGSHIYFAPSYENATGLGLQYDIQAPVDQAASYAPFAFTTFDNNAVGYFGAVFDGRYVYGVPDLGGGIGDVVRYDTQGSFTTNASWVHFALNGVASRIGHHGGLFDGRYVYFVPYEDPAGFHGIVVRYDTQAAFGSSTSWQTFDLTSLNPAMTGFVGAAFDGRFVYIVPTENNYAVRYDTSQSFASSAAWSYFDVSTPFGGTRFRGASFDGRYVWLVPNHTVGASLDVVRIDTTSGAFSTAACQGFDLSLVSAGATGYVSAAFDGEYLYFGPEAATAALRFDARRPRGPLLTVGGSFL
jgi:hypothetical protein